MAFGGTVYCGVDVMGRSSDRRYAYVWALCEEFYRQGGKVLPGSGIAGPVLFDTRASTLTLPGDGTQYGPDVRRLFPPAIATAMLANQVQPDQNDAALTARAERDLLGVAPATSTPAASALDRASLSGRRTDALLLQGLRPECRCRAGGSGSMRGCGASASPVCHDAVVIAT